MTPVSTTLWRAFPWDPEAEDGAAFSPTYFPPPSGTGRFDLPPQLGETALYLAEIPDHAVAEKLQDLRGQILEESDLIEHDHPLALVPATLQAGVRDRILDLCDPDVLSDRAVRPDQLASGRRNVTQAIAATLYDDSDLLGFRWWSALDGEWHTVVLFRTRLPVESMAVGRPHRLTLDHVSVIQATDSLGVARARRA